MILKIDSLDMRSIFGLVALLIKLSRVANAGLKHIIIQLSPKLDFLAPSQQAMFETAW
jgi:hypothetical protein